MAQTVSDSSYIKWQFLYQVAAYAFLDITKWQLTEFLHQGTCVTNNLVASQPSKLYGAEDQSLILTLALTVNGAKDQSLILTLALTLNRGSTLLMIMSDSGEVD